MIFFGMRIERFINFTFNIFGYVFYSIYYILSYIGYIYVSSYILVILSPQDYNHHLLPDTFRGSYRGKSRLRYTAVQQVYDITNIILVYNLKV